MRLVIIVALIFLLIAGLYAASAAPAAQAGPGAAEANYTVSGHETWESQNSPYVIDGHLTIAATGRLTIEAGVEVQIKAASLFLIRNGGQLTVTGTSQDPVSIKAISDRFSSVQIENGARANLAYCDIQSAVAGGAVPVDIRSSNVSFNHCSIHDNGDGSAHAVQIYGTGMSPSISNTTIESNSGNAIHQSTPDMAPAYHNLTLTGNGTDAVVIKQGSLYRSATLDGRELKGKPFLVRGGWYDIKSTGSLTLTQGTTLQFDNVAAGLMVSSGGTLAVTGVAAEPVFISPSDPGGYFRGLILSSGSSASLVSCDVARAGSGGYAVVNIQTANATIDGCTLHDSEAGSPYALYLSGTGISPTIKNSAISNNAGYAIYQSTINMHPTYQNLTLSGNGTDAVTFHSGSLTRKVTLDGPALNGSPFLVKTDWITIRNGAALTITQGTRVTFLAAGTGIDVESGGSLTAVGIEGQPIHFSPFDSGAYFKGVHIDSGARARLVHCDIDRGGDINRAALEILTSDVFIDHCSIHDSKTGSPYALYLFGTGIHPTIQNSVIQNNPGEAIRQTTINMHPVYRNLTLSGNGTNAVTIQNGTLTRKVTLDSSHLGGSPFLVKAGWITVSSGAAVTVTQGTTVNFLVAGTGLAVNSGGSLVVAGTESEPVFIAPFEPSAYIKGLLVSAGGQASLSHCDIARGGDIGRAAVEILSSDVLIDHCIIHDSKAGSPYAVYLHNDGLSPTIQHTNIRDNPGYAIYQTTIDMTPVYRNLTLSGNGTNAVAIHGAYIDRKITLDGSELNGSPFLITESWVNISSGQALTLTAGTELQFKAASIGLHVRTGSLFTAVGTPSQPVIITVDDPSDHFHYILVNTGSTARFAYCDINRGGRESYAALEVYASDFSLSHCLLQHNAALGLRLHGTAGTPVVDNLVVTDNGAGGLRVESGAEAHLHHATIARNNNAGIRIVDGGAAVLTNTILAENEIGVLVAGGGSATLSHTLWDNNLADISGTINETDRLEGQAAFAPDGYHLTGSSAALEQGLDTGLADDIDGDSRPRPVGTRPDIGADEYLVAPESWGKTVNGQVWSPGLSVAVETGDLITFTDVIQVEPGRPFTLTESWDPARLSLVGYTRQPPGVGQVSTAAGSLVWQVDDAAVGAMTVTKYFRIEPCTWTETVLTESLAGLDIPEPERTVTINKIAPLVWIDAYFDRPIHAGEIATFTLAYGNDGGYEIDVGVEARFPATAPFRDADPTPSWQSGDGRSVTWSVGDLAMGESGQINVSVVVAQDVAPSASVVVTGTIHNHADLDTGLVYVDFQVEALPLHDLAVVGATPVGQVTQAETVSVTAELQNQGSELESGVPVRCTVADPGGSLVYSQTVSTGLIGPGAWGQVALRSWSPVAAGAHVLTCRSLLPGDADPSNDAYSHVVMVSAAGGADVWTKDNPEDTGDVPSGHKWWVSPDIWVRHLPDGGLVHQNPIALQENTIYVRLRNRGTQAASGQVGVYWDRSRIGWPCKLWSPNVGVILFEDLLPGEARIVSLAWTPQEVGRHGLHTVIDAESDPPNWNAPCSPHRPRWDNNVSWRNAIVFRHPPAGTQEAPATHEAVVDLVNVYGRPKEVDLVIERQTFPQEGVIYLQFDEGLFDRWQAAEGWWIEGAEVMTPTKEIVVTGTVSATIGGLPMEANETAALALLFNAPVAGAYEVGLYGRVDGQVVGGLTCHWIVDDLTPPQVLGHSPVDAGEEVPLDVPLVIAFSEAIGPLTLDLALAPDPGGWQTAWDQAGKVVTATHAGLIPATVYTATVSAGDASANPMSAPYSWSFTSQALRSVFLPLIRRE